MKARKRVNDFERLNADEATMAGELQSLDAALKEASARLEAARHAEAVEAAKKNAAEMRIALAEFTECGISIDEALAALVEEGAALRAALNKIHVLGAPHPRDEQVNALITNAILTALGATPWKREFRTLAPRERRNMADLVRAWSTNIEANHIAPLLGEAEPAKATVAVSDEAADLTIPGFLRRDPPSVEAQP